jgi:hypothetical protein
LIQALISETQCQQSQLNGGQLKASRALALKRPAFKHFLQGLFQALA